jgi:hypothetical protein
MDIMIVYLFYKIIMVEKFSLEASPSEKGTIGKIQEI